MSEVSFCQTISFNADNFDTNCRSGQRQRDRLKFPIDENATVRAMWLV